MINEIPTLAAFSAGQGARSQVAPTRTSPRRASLCMNGENCTSREQVATRAHFLWPAASRSLSTPDGNALSGQRALAAHCGNSPARLLFARALPMNGRRRRSCERLFRCAKRKTQLYQQTQAPTRTKSRPKLTEAQVKCVVAGRRRRRRRPIELHKQREQTRGGKSVAHEPAPDQSSTAGAHQRNATGQAGSWWAPEATGGGRVNSRLLQGKSAPGESAQCALGRGRIPARGIRPAHVLVASTCWTSRGRGRDRGGCSGMSKRRRREAAAAVEL